MNRLLKTNPKLHIIFCTGIVLSGKFVVIKRRVARIFHCSKENGSWQHINADGFGMTGSEIINLYVCVSTYLFHIIIL